MPITIDGDDSEDELATSMPTHHSKNSFRRKQQKQERHKADSEQHQTEDVDLEETKGPDKKRKNGLSALGDILGAEDATRKKKVKDRMVASDQNVNAAPTRPTPEVPAKDNKKVSRKNLQPDNSESEIEEDIKTTNFDSLSQSGTRRGEQSSRMGKPFDLTSKRKPNPSQVKVKGFYWAGRPELDYIAPKDENGNENMYILVEELKDVSGGSLPGKVYICKEEGETHTCFNLDVVGIVAVCEILN